ncbi:MAG TPA: DegT/DnrJ/EryC1/StrS family aminotransferase [Candidatus Hydrogenedentes bacterium]|nr:DegT/DnrJ/EryC1/StrS family aminotransferase [Candidatus Hydrogenedentota bacterium]
MVQLAISGGKPLRTAPFHGWPVFDEAEESALVEVLRSGKWWRFAFGQGVNLAEQAAGERSQVAMFQEEFARHHECRYGIAAANGTATLELGIRALEFDVGDEVIVPAYTYVASATCVLQNNLVPVFVDVDPDTYNIAPGCIEEAITSRTRAIMAVHFGGQPADMDRVLEIARKRRLLVLEDAAHAHGCEWKGRKAGSFGTFSSFSFQASKNMTAGEGGILCTNDQTVAAECDALTWAGRRPGRPWYEFHRLGWNYRMTEFQAALLRVQMTRLAGQNRVRHDNASYLTELLLAMEGVRPLVQDGRVTMNGYHLYIFRYDEKSVGVPRAKFVEALVAEGIPASCGYPFALYKNPMFIEKQFINGAFPLGTAYHGDMDYAAFEARCPVAERACSGEAVWLPQQVFLGTHGDMHDIAAAVAKVLKHKEELA